MAANRVIRHAQPGMRRGAQSLVETAFVLPIMLMMLLAAVDFGRSVYASVTVQAAAREGARYAASNRCTTSGACSTQDAAIRTRVLQAIGANDPTGAGNQGALSACSTDPPANTGKPCVAIANYQNFITPLAPVSTRDSGNTVVVRVYADVTLVAAFMAEGVDGFAPGLTGLCYMNGSTKVCRVPVMGEAYMVIF